MALFLAANSVLLLFPTVIAMLFLFAALYGAANGMMTILRGTSVPEFLGRGGVGAITGALTLPASLAAAAAPSLAALIWEIAGGYHAVLLAMLGASAIAAAGFAFAAIKAR